uniref:Uncharacterized protein n=1 Tax=Oryzias latipes TaxID=8090 RepID=A0A3P9H6T9_ORYLA
VCRSESLSAESRSVQSSTGYRLTKSRSESDLSQPESDEEGCNLSGRRNIDLDLAFSQKKKGNTNSHAQAGLSPRPQTTSSPQDSCFSQTPKSWPSQTLSPLIRGLLLM